MTKLSEIPQDKREMIPSERLCTALKSAEAEAEVEELHYFGTQHLLIAISGQDDGTGKRILNKLNVKADDIRKAWKEVKSETKRNTTG